MISNWVHPEYLDVPAIRTLSSRFPKAKPFPHMVLRDFFSPAKIRRVREELLNQSFEFRESDLFRFHQTTDISNLPSKVLQEFYDFFNSKEFTAYTSRITKTRVSRADMSGFIYSSTDHLLPHDDRLEGRKIAYIVNLSQGFTKKDGGALSFFTTKKGSPAKIVRSFIPTFNTLFLFKVTPKSFHQVDEVLAGKKRLTLAGWFY
jgi:Rps23 Pro-64 3,4-dihydroxylase Tpa1-like proline 4-hydroxylase